ncbi:MAG: hypothetical protein ACI4HO_01795 [Ruminococcus sp.]
MKVKYLEFIKKIFCVFLVLGIIILSLCSCSGNGNYVYDGEAQYYDDESEINDIHDLNIDLSEYSDHGELSCGRIWLEKEEGSWDEYPESQFAYFDADGNQITDWFLSDNFIKGDYLGDFLVLPEYRPEFGTTSHICHVYDLDGNEMAQFCDETGYFCYTGINEDGKRLYQNDQREIGWMDSTGVYLFNTGDKKDDIRIMGDEHFTLEKVNDYYILIVKDSDYDSELSMIFDQSLNLVLDFNDIFGWRNGANSINFISENNIEVEFVGEDDKFYKCVVDLQGNFIEEPTPLYD